MKIIHILGMLLVALVVKAASPIEGLLERIDKGASRKFMIEQVKSPVDFFELDQKGDKVVIRGNNYVSIATGLNWYLKYHVGIHLSWNGMQAELPEVLPAVKQKERHETDMKYRYDFNYCTFSYTMAFWDWTRWEKEIDWMALHGINLPLAMVGTGWRLVQCAEQVRLYEGRNQRFCSRSRFPGLVVDEQLGRLGRPESG